MTDIKKMVKRKIARVWQLDVENIGKGRALGDILVNDDAIKQNRKSGRSASMGK